MVYYNEFGRHVAAWLRELIKDGQIPQGTVDDRDIRCVRPGDCGGTSHFFAGIGGWPYALRLAGWPDDRPAWTGSCPCQPLSCAGQRKGEKDQRHLWPEFYRLISECRPGVVFGEQVGTGDGPEWLDGISLDLEELGYAVGSNDLPAASVGAPHIRQRLFWVAISGGAECGWRTESAGQHGRALHTTDRREPCGVAYAESLRAGAGIAGEQGQSRSGRNGSANGGIAGRLADTDGGQSGDGRIQRGGQHGQQPQDGGAAGGLGNADRAGLSTSECQVVSGAIGNQEGRAIGQSGSASSIGVGDAQGGGCGVVGDAALARSGGHVIRPDWTRFDLVPCRDGKTRRVESGTFPLAYGLPGRVGLLRGYGNAIVPEVAAEFIGAVMEILGVETQHQLFEA